MSDFIKLCTFILLMHGECRGEPLNGQIAVAQVVFQRGIDSNTVDFKQFNCFKSKKVRKALLNNKKNIVLTEIWDNVSLTNILQYYILYQYRYVIKAVADNSTYYWTKKSHKFMKIKHSKWLKKLKHTKTIGNLKFFAELK